MINFDDKALAAIKSNNLDPQDIKLVLSKIPQTMPHLYFIEHWTIFEDKDGSCFAHRVKDGAHCHVQIKDTHIATKVYAMSDGISNHDIEILNDLCTEAAKLVSAAAEIGVSLADFGVNAMANAIARYIPVTAPQVKNYFKSLRSLAGETYENQRISYGLILLPQRKRKASSVLEFDNKRFKRLTDGFSTAIVLDANGAIVNLTSLRANKENKGSSRGRPWWISPLADTADGLGGIGIALTKGGDILVVRNRELIMSQRAGEWRFWCHRDIIAAIRQSWSTRGAPVKINKVLVALYRVALDLAFRRSGGLLVVVSSHEKLSKMVTASGDLIGAPAKSNAEQALDECLSTGSVLSMDRRVIADLASLDGALVVNRTGHLLAYGAMVRSNSTTTQQGARTRAAIGASRYGLAIKVSSDGGISIYRKGERVLVL